MSDTGQPATPPAKTVAAAPAPDASRVMTLFVMIVATLYGVRPCGWTGWAI